VADARIDRGTVNLVFGRAIRLAEKTTTDFTDQSLRQKFFIRE
jgi:hypothetical protein